MRKYIGHVLDPRDTTQQDQKVLAKVNAHISNGGVNLTIAANANNQPEIHLCLSTFGSTAVTTFFLAAEGLRDFGLAFLKAAHHPFDGWYCCHGQTPHSPGLNPEHRTPEGGQYRIEIPEEELLRRRDLLRAELDRVETQLAQVVDAPAYNDRIEAFKRIMGGTNAIMQSGGQVVHGRDFPPPDVSDEEE